MMTRGYFDGIGVGFLMILVRIGGLIRLRTGLRSVFQSSNHQLTFPVQTRIKSVRLFTQIYIMWIDHIRG